MAAQHKSVRAGKYAEKTRFEKKKSLHSFKQEIVKSVVKSYHFFATKTEVFTNPYAILCSAMFDKSRWFRIAS